MPLSSHIQNNQIVLCDTILLGEQEITYPFMTFPVSEARQLIKEWEKKIPMLDKWTERRYYQALRGTTLLALRTHF